MDAAILDLLRQVRVEKDEERAEDLKARSSHQLGQHFLRTPSDLEEFAFDLLNNVWADAMAEDIVPQVIQVKNVGLADPDYIEEDLRGLRAYWQGKGGQIRSDIIRYERAQMPREEMVTALDFHQDEIATNFWGTFDDLVTQSREKLSQLPTERLIELVQAAIVTGDTFGSFAASTLTDDQIDPVIEEVALRSKGNVTLLGTRPALRHLAGVGLEFGDRVAEQIFNTGQIGQYKGYAAVQVENFEDFAGNFVLPNDELWVVGQNSGRLTYYGDNAKVQQLKLPSFMLRWETARDAGMLLFGAAKGRIGRIKLT
ncbi:MAG: hypothetical protein Q8Q29_02050 [Actinomycetota bacterium]|nr:hypothetical protein [Actinomycetota bacterium]